MHPNQKTILLIDDDQSLHALIKATMRKSGYRLVSAFNGQNGLEAILREHPEVVILDYLLPDMMGDQVYAELISNPRLATVCQTPIIVLTGKELTPAQRDRFLAGSFTTFLQKPFGKNELLNVIDNVLRQAEVQRRNQQLQSDLQQTSDYLESLIQQLPLGILSVDRQGNILKINRYLRQLLKPTQAARLINKNIFDIKLFHYPALAAELRSLLELGLSFQSAPLDFFVAPGRKLKLVLSGVPLQAPDTTAIAGGLLLVQDVTQAIEREHSLSMLSQISEFMQRTMALDELLHLILTAVTAGCAMGFSRAMILLVNSETGFLEGRMGVGPASEREAHRIWNELSREDIPLSQFLEKYGRRVPVNDYFNELVKKISVPLNWQNCVFIQALKDKRSYRLRRNSVQIGIAPELLDELKVDEFVIVPLLARDTAVGLVVADNQYSQQVIDDKRLNLLSLFSMQAGLAIERAENYHRLDVEKKKLEQAYQQLKSAQDRLLQAERLATIGEMAAQVAHEIRNPLVTIGGFGRKILKAAEGSHDQQLQNIARIITEEVDRLENILTNLLSFSRLSRPKLELADIHQVIEDSCYLIDAKENLVLKKIHLVTDFDRSLPKTYLDPAQIKQVLLNLLENAIAVMPDGGKLSVTTRRDNDFIRVSITDTGPGIAPEVLDKMFNPFFTTRAGGTGLGLPIAEQIILSHGGKIDVDSQLGRGTTFHFSLKIMATASPGQG
ncbi:MAG: ATP-binding protein [candidate division KSB1 bacterium]|nr:ATP-binding protein [candidate division KSB1 bacterium]MDZ7339813.1 ATP-binding protein [candidate division KSB1 bacterium]